MSQPLLGLPLFLGAVVVGASLLLGGSLSSPGPPFPGGPSPEVPSSEPLCRWSLLCLLALEVVPVPHGFPWRFLCIMARALWQGPNYWKFTSWVEMAEEREHGSTHGCVVLVKLCGCLLVCFLFPHIKKTYNYIYIYTCIFILKYDCLDIIGVMQHKNVICLVYVCLVLYNEFWLNMYLHSDEYTYICICIYIYIYML